AGLGYGVPASGPLELREGGGAGVVDHLRRIPELLALHPIPGAGDMLCRIVARSNRDLQRVIARVVGDEDIVRTSTLIVLSTPIPYRVLPLVAEAAGGA